MSRTTIIVALLALSSGVAWGGTFVPTAIDEGAGIDVVTESVSRQMLDRQLFGNPYASVVVGNVDVYDRFPYLEARYFQVVSDPQWNRLLYGEVGKDLRAFDGAATAAGALADPRGMAVDPAGRIYVADSGNDRVIVLNTRTEFDRMDVEVAFVIDGLRKPSDVAHSDGGTPFDSADDVLYVVDAGRSQVARYALEGESARRTASLGEMGSGAGRFAGPMSVTVGRVDGVNTGEIYVSDVHNGRIVRLQDDGENLAWIDSWSFEGGVVTSLATDHWGHVYAATPQGGHVTKMTPDLQPLAQLKEGVARPRSFHVPFVTVRDHRSGDVSWTGQGRGLLVEEWNDDHGLRVMELGVEVRDLAVTPEDGTSLRFELTERSSVRAEVLDASGKTIWSSDLGEKNAGAHAVDLDSDASFAALSGGSYRMRVAATTTYEDGFENASETSFLLSSDGRTPAAVDPQLLGNHPNPFNPSTRIDFLVPAGAALPYRLEIFDARGRLVRTLGEGTAQPGLTSVIWDGRSDSGSSVGSGVYLYRLDLDGTELSDTMVLVK